MVQRGEMHCRTRSWTLDHSRGRRISAASHKRKTLQLSMGKHGGESVDVLLSQGVPTGPGRPEPALAGWQARVAQIVTIDLSGRLWPEAGHDVFVANWCAVVCCYSGASAMLI